MVETWQDEDEFDEPESWDDDDDSNATVECRNCGADVYEDAPRCPVCGEYMLPATGAFAGRPGWWVLIAVVLLVAIVFAFVLR